jgi:cephalosporin-C deacetylase-like acetyl esterase
MRILIFLAMAALFLSSRAADESWVLFPKPGETTRDQLKLALNQEGKKHLRERQRAISALRTSAEAAERQKVVREKILRLMGGLPTEKTPLRTRHVGTEEREGYRYEKIIYESQPGFYVPANVYLPTRGQGPFPAILMPVGHSPDGKEGERTTAIGLARKGFVVLKYDPIGQGERLQYYDPELRASKVGSTTEEHSHANGHAVLIGDNVARYRVWDGIRGIDYLLTRPDVDPKRIGVTGCSGGGTLTTYISAIDSRVQAAAPACYITSWEQLLDKLGPQDGEQSLANFLSEGLDIADYIEVFAPKPYLIASTIGDFFTLEGARQSYEEARGFYRLLQAEDRIGWFIGPGGHGVPRESREAIYAFFLKHLNNGQGDPRDEAVVLDPLEKILCTPTGQVSDSLGGETVFTLNRKRAEALKRHPAAADLPAQVRKLAGITVKPGGAAPVVTVHRSLRRDGYRLDLVSLAMGGGVAVTGSLLVPGGSGPHPTAILVDPRPKEVTAALGSDADALARAGFVVLAIQPRGTPERPVTALPNISPPLAAQNLVGDFDLAYQAQVVGRSLTGLRAEDVIRAVDYLSAFPGAKRDGLTAIGYGTGGVYVLHAAALDSRIARVLTQQSPPVLRLGVERPIHRHIYEVAVPGMLTKYDLDDLVRAIAPRPVTIINPVDLLERPLHATQVRQMVAAPAEIVLRGRRDPLPVLR